MGYFDFFDRFFFAGKLRPCSVYILLSYDGEPMRYGETISPHSHRRYPDFDQCRDKIFVRIEISPGNAEEPLAKREIDQIETLLHEMTHAVFLYYGCQCDLGSWEDKTSCICKCFLGLCIGGHGQVWQSVYMHIQEICFKLRLIPGTSAKFAFDRELCLVKEIINAAKVFNFTVDTKMISEWSGEL